MEDINKLTVDQLDAQRMQLVTNFQGREKTEEYFKKFELLSKLIREKSKIEYHG